MESAENISSQDGVLKLLQGASAFALLPETVLREIGSVSCMQRFASGTTVIHEGEEGDAAYFIASGTVEVWVSGTGAPVATLGVGDLFGEFALLSLNQLRTASVVATTPLNLLRISAADFHRYCQDHPELRAQLDAAREKMEKTRFLKLAATPFSNLDNDRLQALIDCLQPLSLSAGSILLRQGELGDACYFVRSGKLEVILEAPGNAARQIAQAGPGSLIGEAALLTNAPRNATVCALESCKLLVLRRSELLSILGSDHVVGRGLQELLELRSRPCRRLGVEAYKRVTHSGENLTILKDRGRGVYYQLSPQGRFVWDRLDGAHTLRDLAREYLHEFHAFAPQVIMDVIAGLARGGFVDGVGSTLARNGAHASRMDRILETIRNILEYQASIGNVDDFFTRVYRGGVRVLYSVPAQLALAVLAVAGIIAFVMTSGTASHLISQTGPASLLLLFPASLVILLFHELGHAFTTKHFGREVLRVGIGWYWFGPVGFVDTSDMWLADRWPRIVVSLAGPYVGLLVGSAAALIAAATNGVWVIFFWQLALAAYSSTLINLNPLMELDGYYILSDYLEHPNLRPKAMAWVGRVIGNLVAGKAPTESNTIYILYSLGSIIFIAFMGYGTVLLYRVLLQNWLATFLSGALVAGIGWLFAAAIIFLMIAGVFADLRREIRKF